MTSIAMSWPVPAGDTELLVGDTRAGVHVEPDATHVRVSGARVVGT
jgi:hypothetical protein